mmetsp:Transcript_32094/g.102108  ORF Transcript_32094/g.102108 Transcript_32094/m.102108 type:complete len:245 (+) Transcript_32094:264-998(+)
MAATFSQLYIRRTRSWNSAASTVGRRSMAAPMASRSASGSGGARMAMSSGSTSGMPPTSVLTGSRPQAAASRMAMQKDSVSEQLRKICPRASTRGTSGESTCPRISTRSWSSWFSRVSSRMKRFGPSPPMMMYTFGCRRQSSGSTFTSRSMPLRSVSRLRMTIFTEGTRAAPSPTCVGLTFAASGWNRDVSTAFGMTCTSAAGSCERTQRFSAQASDTAMARSAPASAHLSSPFTCTLVRSPKP